MKKEHSMMKRLCVLLAALLLSVAAFPVNKGLVTDDAQVFTQEEKAALEGKLRAFEQATSVEFAVVTVTSLDGMDIDAYRNALFKAWGIGKRGKDNGLLMVVAPNEGARGKVGIEVGYGLEGLLTDSAVGTIIREHVVPGWRSAHRADGIVAGVDALIARLSSKPAEAATSVQAQDVPAPDGDFLVWLLALLGVGGTSTVVMARMQQSKRREKERDAAREASLWREPPAQAWRPSPPPAPPAAYVPVEAYRAPRREPERRREDSSPSTSSYHDDSSSRFSSGSSFDSGSSSYDFGGGSSGGGGSSSDL